MADTTRHGAGLHARRRGTDESVGLAHRFRAVTSGVIFGGGGDFRPHRPKPTGAIVDASLLEVPERLTSGR